MFSQTSKEKTVQFDTEFIELKKFDNKKIEAYKKQDAFIYVVEKIINLFMGLGFLSFGS